ncbi:unnamed protein product [Rodentolepis nana]|uniref:PUM-HD domain-containing protein n=1 Tax=Rodentolepis nana TaxID=102285 RepID=A0A0R3THG0_RODNA|nr:unnamed protein product [Rodentolepis nana]
MVGRIVLGRVRTLEHAFTPSVPLMVNGELGHLGAHAPQLVELVYDNVLASVTHHHLAMAANMMSMVLVVQRNKEGMEVLDASIQGLNSNYCVRIRFTVVC